MASLILPPGWAETPKPRGIEKEVQGLFANASLPGVTLMAVGYKGMGMTMAKALDAGIKTFKIPVPNAQPVEVQDMEVEGKKINFVAYKGTSVGAGTEVGLAAAIAVTKADKCYLNLIAIGPSTVLAPPPERGRAPIMIGTEVFGVVQVEFTVALRTRFK